MNSNRDPMLAPGHEGMMFFDTSADDTVPASDLLFGEGFVDQGDLMDDMFMTSPQRSMAKLDDQTAHARPPTLAQQGSSPEDLSDSSSVDSARHQRKTSSLSFHTDVDMLDSRLKNPRLDVASQRSASSAQTNFFPLSTNADMEAMAHDFDFESAAGSPSLLKSPNVSIAALSDMAPTQSARSPFDEVIDPQAFAPPALVKTESLASPSPLTPSQRSQSSNQNDHSSSNRQLQYMGSVTPSYRMHIHPIPPKSRVETQIPIKLTITPLPANIEKLHLPTHTISKPKLIARPAPEPALDTLELHSMLVCTSAMQDPVKRAKALRRAALKTRQMEAEEKKVLPHDEALSMEDPEHPINGGEVFICRGCITRERKRAARKKSKKPDEEAAWTSDEARRVIVFNTQEIRQWEDPEDEPETNGPNPEMPSFPPGSKQIKMPMRIACYCRHHAEKLGFQVILTLKDHKSQLVGQAMSDPIIITDDHKAQPLANGSAANASQWQEVATGLKLDPQDTQRLNHLSRNAFSSNDLASLQGAHTSGASPSQTFSPFATSQPGQHEGAKNGRGSRSRPVSPSSSSGHSAKRRKASGPKLPESLMMTKAQNVSPSSANSSAVNSGVGTGGVFGFTFPAVPPAQQQRAPSFPSGPPTPDSASNDFWANTGRAQSFDTTSNSQAMFSTSSSRIQSRAPSPATQALQSAQNAASRQSQAFAMPVAQVAPAQRAPVINKIVPHEGPIAGGIEVTCLGSGFYNGLEVVFGSAPATTTTYWGETTLVCLLPPADRPGLVPVTFKNQHDAHPTPARSAKMSFKYVDEEEQELFKQAFIILSQKMTGAQAGDPADFARQALNSPNGNSSWQPYGGQTGHYRQMSGTAPAFVSEDTESSVMRCLEMIEQDESRHHADLDFPRSNGQTLLHLAASLGYHRLVSALLARGSDPNFADRNGFTPLHVASMRGHGQIVRKLRFHGANPALRSRSGFIAAEMAATPLVVQMLDVRTQVRSRSFGSSSLQSLALATPPRSRANSASRHRMHDEWDSSSDDDSGDDPPNMLPLAKSQSWRHSRRNSAVETSSGPAISENLNPAAAIVAWRDNLSAQIQQFQQTVEGMLPHLQMPTMPAIPPLVGIGNYQTPPMVRKISSLVPQRTSRPGSPAGSTGSGKDGDHRWWDFFTGSQPTPSEPPAYHDIYPGDEARGLDSKAAAIAATEARNLKLPDTTSSRKSRHEESVIQSETFGETSEEFSMAQADRKTSVWSDKNLFFIWIPLLLLIMTLTFRGTARNYIEGFFISNERITEPRIVEVAN